MTAPSRSRYQIVPIGSQHTGFALKVDGVVRRSDPRMLPLAAWVDAVIAGASDADADAIAKSMAARPWPTHEEVMATFTVTGPWRPSREPFKKLDRP
jgi:hypothetical protein